MNMRKEARRIFNAGVAAASPFQAVTRQIDQVVERPALIVAVGKAAGQMACAAMARFGDAQTLVVTNYENAQPLEGAEVFAAGHPVPDDNGAAAARAVIAAVGAADGPILALISGGGSALLPAPADALTLADKAAVNTLLLGAGMDIQEMNLIRQQLSELKGGGLLRHAAPRHVTALILSDVIGDDHSAIASGPTAAPIGSAAEAAEALQAAGLWEQVPDTVRAHLGQVRPPAPLHDATNILVGSNTQSVAAMADVAEEVRVLPEPIIGDVADAARSICDQAEGGITVWGGETTVVLKGDGRGGRNQELALRIALEATRRGWHDWVCLQGGSDGRDGPTGAAGGLVDHETLNKINTSGGDIHAFLANNDSYAALDMAGDLLMTGATGTNVADLGVMIRRG